jgi:hypothetical protein
MAKEQLKQYLETLPASKEIRDRLCENLREARLLRQLLKLAEQREKVREVSTCK